MSRTHRMKGETATDVVERWYVGTGVTMTLIRKHARQIVERFQPEKIILFGSHAYGTPHSGSDVDVLVIMPARNELAQAWKIDRTLDREFSLHLIVRTPRNVAWRLQEGDWFLREVISRGQVLYEKTDAGVGRQSGRRLPSGTPARGTRWTRGTYRSPGRRGRRPSPSAGRTLAKRGQWGDAASAETGSTIVRVDASCSSGALGDSSLSGYASDTM